MLNKKYSLGGSTLGKLLGTLILIVCSIYIYQKFSKDDLVDWSQLDLQRKMFDKRGILFLSSVLIMTFFNWLVEAMKWKYLLKQIIPMRISSAYSSVVMGLAFTIITPFRVGSFVGRIWNFPKNKRYNAALASVFGGLGQLFVTVCLGLIALQFQLNDSVDMPIQYLGLFSIALLVLVIAIYFGTTGWINICNRFMPSFNFSKSFEVLASYNLKEKLVIIGYSSLRYVIFLVQYYLLIKLLNPDASLTLFFWPLALIFFITSVVPSLIFGIGLRETIAVLLLGSMVTHEATLIIASLLLWLTNMILPATIGALIFIFKKTIKS